ncbi:MAG: pantetheine-phosphate adenylyltransferase [Candidatus Bathyarchaeia archaeon]
MSRNPKRYSKVAVGGTFDQLHKGHRQLLRTALTIGEHVVIGITSDKLVKTLHKPHKVDPFVKRRDEVVRFLDGEKAPNSREIIELNDRFGITLNDPDLEALVVSRRSEPMAAVINSMRRERGLRPIDIVAIDMILAMDRRPISTTRIRRGVIDREGTLTKPSLR